MAGGGGGFLAGMNDGWLKPRLLRSLVRDRLPQPAGGDVPPAELVSILEAVRTHGLLSERLPGPPDPVLAEAWRAAVDAWVERLLALVDSKTVYSRWVGTCFLGLTFQECSDERFAESYPDWFEKVLINLQEPPISKIFTMVFCTAMTDLFVRLAKFTNLKKEAVSFAGRVVEPVLVLLNENGSVSDKAVDFLSILIKFYPSSVNRYYNKVESAIASKVMSAEFNVEPSKKFAGALALLPCIRASEDSWSQMIQKILIVVNNLLSDAFLGLEEEKKGLEIMKLLVPPGNDIPPSLGGQTRSGGHVHVTKKFRVSTVPAISALIHCCCVMLTGSYPVQVNVPVRALIALIRRVLFVDGSLCKTLFPSTTSLHQELICSELPSLHSSFLDFLSATIKGLRSQLLPHAANVVRLIAEYFKIAKIPTIRTKVYCIVRLLLISLGVGMSLHLLQDIVSNAVADLDDSGGSDSLLSTTNPSQATSEASLKKYSKKRKQESQMQNSLLLGLEKAAIIPKKMKNSSTSNTSHGMTPEPTTVSRRMTPLSVKIAALETLEILLNVGGSLRTDYWRAEVDLALIKVAKGACDIGVGNEKKPSTVGKPSISDFQLASLKALLASFLSPSHARPPYLAQGLELFRRGKLETGSKLANFCSHALLALDVLIHPRALPLERAVPGGPGFSYGAPEKVVFGTTKFELLPFGGKNQAMYDLEDEEMYDNWLPSNTDDEPTDALVKGSFVGKDASNKLSRDPEQDQDDQQHTAIKEDPQIDPPEACEAVQYVPKSSEIDAKMTCEGTEEKSVVDRNTVELNTMDNRCSSIAISTQPCRKSPDPQKPVLSSVSEKHTDPGGCLQAKSLDEDMSSNNPKSLCEGSVVSGGASSSHKAPWSALTSFAPPNTAKLFDSDLESEDSMPDIVDGDPDSD